MDNFVKLHRNYLWIIGIVCGICCGLDLPLAAVAAVSVLLLSCLLIYFRCRREILCLLLAAAAGFCSGNAAGKKEHIRACRFNDAVISINDANAAGKVLREGETLPVRLTGKLDNNADLGLVQLYFPRKMPNPGLLNGDKIKVTGNFYPPQSPPEFFRAAAGGEWENISSVIRRDGYSNYLRRRNISGTLVVESITCQSGENNNFFGRVRRSINQRLDAGISDRGESALLSAVTQGVYSRLDREVRKKFTAVGAAHLFSVSGLHVGVIAALLLLAARPLPKAVHYLVSAVLVCYVMTTGGNAPAWRAFGMVVLLELLRRKLLYTGALELLSLICAVMLLINPYYITDAGFQYSFIVTAALIAAAPAVNQINTAAYSAAYFWGEQNIVKRFFQRWRSRICSAFSFALTASAVSWVLTLYHQNQIFFGSVLVNLLILPILTPLFLLALLKTLLPGWGEIFNRPIELMLGYLELVADLFYSSSSAHALMRPAPLLAAGIIVLLLMMVIYRQSRWSTVFALLLGGLIIGGTVRSAFQPERIAVVCAGGDLEEPVMALLMPRSHCMYLWNAGFPGVTALNDAAVHYGINRIERLDFSRPVKACSDGVKWLTANYFVSRFRRGSQPIRSQVFRENTADLILEQGAEKERLSIGSAPHDTMKLDMEENGSWKLDFDGRTFRIPRSSVIGVYMVPAAL